MKETPQISTILSLVADLNSRDRFLLYQKIKAIVEDNRDLVGKVLDCSAKVVGEDIMNRTRKWNVVEGRYFVCHYLYQHSTMTLQEIGDIFEINGSTVIYGRDKVSFWLDNSDVFPTECRKYNRMKYLIEHQ